MFSDLFSAFYHRLKYLKVSINQVLASRIENLHSFLVSKLLTGWPNNSFVSIEVHKFDTAIEIK
jgi:hypothetical protein